MERHIHHPDAVREAAHLKATEAIIRDELGKLEVELGIRAEEERIVAVRFEGDQAQVVMNTLRMKLQALHQMALAQKQPYFARVDYTPRGQNMSVYYIGRWGVMKTPEYETAVVDWRSPIANLYYSGQTGPMSYETPDGKVEGELSLKRIYTVHDGELESMFDSGIVSQDAYLQGVLGAVSTDRLKEIVTTIQAEQNFVIRHPLEKPLIVQGVAGSGKTTIALHRIAWLLYAYRETLNPWQMMILAPNPLFLDYISQVLPDLGVESVIQTTFAGLCEKWLGKQMPRLKAPNRLEDKLICGPEERNRMAAILKRKGSLAFKAAVEEALKAFEAGILPAGDILFGPVTLFTAEQLQDIYTRQLKHFPLHARVRELCKYMRTRLKDASERMISALDQMAEEKLTVLLQGLPDGAERQARAGRLLASRDLRKAAVTLQAKNFAAAFDKLFPDMRVTRVYKRFLEAWGGFDDTCALLEKGMAFPEDLPALAVIMRKTHGIPFQAVQTIMIDEAQDFSPFQMQLLKDMDSRPSFTLVGDLMQGVHEEEGISSWREIAEDVFQGDITYHDLVQSYRNTVEIMRFANRVASRYPVAGQKPAHPVLRHGGEVLVKGFRKDRERMACAAGAVRQWLADGYHSVALVEKTASEAGKTFKLLQAELPVTLMTGEQKEYRGGVMVIPASQVKGLEFDCVLVMNASDDHYPDDAFTARLLYVILTRPLHHLALFYTGEPTCLI